MKKIRRQSLIFIIITTAFASCISMLGGLGIELTAHELLPIVPLVIALPALNTMVGDYATIIAAHAGSPGERTVTRKKLVSSILKSTRVNICGTIGLSIVLSERRGYEVHPAFLLVFSLFVAVSVLSIVAVMFIVTYILDKILEEKQLNPDDILIPVVTTITDVFMLGLIALAAKTIF